MSPAPTHRRLRRAASRVAWPAASRVAVAVAALLVASSAATVAPARAGTDSDIPGVPLPGPVVTGLLGGDIYDHVFRLSVPPGNVILASLTGDPGTDFDLYLFDSTATSILANPPVGLVAKSTGPTSTESISYPSRSGGTYYLDVSGFSDTQGAFRLSVTIQPDTVAPTVSLRIQGGSAYISDPTVTLTIVAQDALSGVDVMQISTDGITWTAWQPYAPTMLWTFPTGDGPRQLWVRVRDRAGNTSAVAEAQTVLDTVPPTVVGVSPADGSVVGSLRPLVRVTFSKPMVPTWWTTGGMRLHHAAGGPDVPGTFTYDDSTRTGAFLPGVDLVAGTIYQAEIANLYDLAGNRLTPYPAWTFTPKQPIPLKLVLTPSSITSGGSAVAAGTAIMSSPAAVELQQFPAGASDWTTIAAAFPDAVGVLRVQVAPRITTAYRLHVAGSPSNADSTSPTATLGVRFQVALVGPTPGVTRVARAGAVQPLVAQLSPATHGVVVTFRLYRWDTAKRAWAPFVSAKRTTNTEGRATWTWTHRPGTWYVRATSAATPANTPGTSPVYRWSVK
jgi:hypothetical protein